MALLFEENYDKLSSCSFQLPTLPGSDLKGISLKLFQDGQNVDRQISDPDVKDVAVIGAGYIGWKLLKQRNAGAKMSAFSM